MGKKYIALVSLLVILSFIGYIVYDTISSGEAEKSEEPESREIIIPDNWFVFNSLTVSEGKLTFSNCFWKGRCFYRR